MEGRRNPASQSNRVRCDVDNVHAERLIKHGDGTGNQKVTSGAGDGMFPCRLLLLGWQREVGRAVMREGNHPLRNKGLQVCRSML